MKNNVLQTIILALVGFAILFVGFLLLCSVCGEPDPEYNSILEERFGVFALFAALGDNIIRGLAGFLLIWVGYKVYPFRDDTPEYIAVDTPDEQEQPVESKIKLICNE